MDGIDAPSLGPWLRRAGPGEPVELVTRDHIVPVDVADWLRLVREGFDLFGPELRAAGLEPRGLKP